MTLEEDWAKVDKEAIRLKRKAARESICPKHVWIKKSNFSDECIICGLYRRKYPNQYYFRYMKGGKHSQDKINERWEMYNQGIDLVEYDEIKLNKILGGVIRCQE